MYVTIPKSGYAQIALALLLMSGFGATFTGVTLLIGLLSSPAARELGGDAAVLPLIGIAWGIGSLVGAYGVWRFRPWARWAVVGVQGLIAVALASAFLGGARDWSVVLVFLLAAGAVVAVLFDARRRGAIQR